MAYNFPPALRRGDTIRVIAASGPVDRTVFMAGIAHLVARGLTPVYDEALFSRSRYLAGTDAQRHDGLHQALADPDARAVWAARGGYGAARLLAACPPSRVAQAGKWLVGFSDVSALHCTWARAGLGSMHGANVTTLAKWGEGARDAMFAWLFGAGEALLLQGEGRVGEHAVEGPVWGGNLTVLASLCGTGFLPSLRGHILFLEDIGERPYRLDRSLTQLRLAGVLDGVVGVAIGQLTDCAETQSAVDYGGLEVLVDILRPLGIPVVGGLPVGHEDTSWALPLGAVACLDPTRGTLTVRAVSDVQRG